MTYELVHDHCYGGRVNGHEVMTAVYVHAHKGWDVPHEHPDYMKIEAMLRPKELAKERETQ